MPVIDIQYSTKNKLKKTLPYIISAWVKVNLWLYINYIALRDSIGTII